MASPSDMQEHDETKNWPLFDVVQDYSDHYYADSNKNFSNTDPIYKTISKEWRNLKENLPDSIYVRVYEQRVDLMRAAIVGPPGTPYQDGLFVFDIRFPSRYPDVPPKVHYRSHGVCLNPNLYSKGYVSLSLLNTWDGRNPSERWIPSESTILQVLVSIQTLVLNRKPYFNKPDIYTNSEISSNKYNEKVFQLSCYSMEFLLNDPPKNFKGLVEGHFRKRSQAILTACKVYMHGFERVGNYYYQENKLFQNHKEKIKVSASFRNEMDMEYKNLVVAFRKIDPMVDKFVEQLEDLVKERMKKKYTVRRVLWVLKKTIWPFF